MKTNKEKFLQLVSKEKTSTADNIRKRNRQRKFLKLSQGIALDILTRLSELEWTQKRLADEMGVSPQMVNKWVRGGENFTLETLINLEMVLGRPLICRYPSERQQPARKAVAGNKIR